MSETNVNSVKKNSTNPSDRKRAIIDQLVTKLEKEFGSGSIMIMGQKPVEKIESISTGSIALDAALGIGGFPRGRIVEIFGPESSGKTTLALHAIAEAQKAGGTCAFIDAEHALDISYASKLGVNVKELIVSQPDTGEQALHIAESLVCSGAIDVIIVDSVAALTPRAEIEGDMGDQHVGLQARLLSHALRKLTVPVSRAKCILIFINQIRMKIGISYGNPEVTSGGYALKFYSSVRLEIRRISSIKAKEETIGNRTKVKVIKNKVAPPFKQVEFDIIYNEGISKFGEMIDLGTGYGIITKSGSYYSYKDVKLGQGKDNAKTFLRSDPQLASEVERLIRDRISEDKDAVVLGKSAESVDYEEDDLLESINPLVEAF